MFNQHPAGEEIKKMIKSERAAQAVKEHKAANPVLDAVDESSDAAQDYVQTDVALKAVAALQEWAETSPDDLDEGEGLGDRLFAMFVGIADANMDGEIGEDEQEILAMAAEEAWDYLSSKGVSDEDLGSLLSDFDNDVAANVQEMLAAALPEGDAAEAEIDAFVFGDGSDESAMDAVYKKRMVIRKGKKVRINKRVSGKVRLSSKQKVAIRKAGMKSHRASAQMRRAKSMRMRTKVGL